MRSSYALVLATLGLLGSTCAHASVPLGNPLPTEAGGALLALAVAGVIAGIYIKRRKR